MPQVNAINDKGCQQILWLYEDEHYVTEVGTMNIMMYWKNEQGGQLNRDVISPILNRKSIFFFNPTPKFIKKKIVLFMFYLNKP